MRNSEVSSVGLVQIPKAWWLQYHIQRVSQLLKKESVEFCRHVVGDENFCLDPRRELYKGKEMQNEETLQSFADTAVSVH